MENTWKLQKIKIQTISYYEHWLELIITGDN